MSAPAVDRDLDILRTIAVLRVVTVHQLALLSGRKHDTLRRQLSVLEKRQLVQAGAIPVNGSRGRPEKILSLTSTGLKRLRDAGLDTPEIATEPLTMLHPKLVRHQLLIGTVRAHLSLLTRTWPEFQAKFLLPSDSVLAGRSDERVSFVPDAVIGLSHIGLGRTLLFFLEADRGTETLSIVRRAFGFPYGAIIRPSGNPLSSRGLSPIGRCVLALFTSPWNATIPAMLLQPRYLLLMALAINPQRGLRSWIECDLGADRAGFDGCSRAARRIWWGMKKAGHANGPACGLRRGAV